MNSEKPEIPFRKIYDGNLKQQIEVYKKFAKNMENRKTLKQISHPIDNNSDPLLLSLRDK